MRHISLISITDEYESTEYIILYNSHPLTYDLDYYKYDMKSKRIEELKNRTKGAIAYIMDAYYRFYEKDDPSMVLRYILLDYYTRYPRMTNNTPINGTSDLKRTINDTLNDFYNVNKHNFIKTKIAHHHLNLDGYINSIEYTFNTNNKSDITAIKNEQLSGNILDVKSDLYALVKTDYDLFRAREGEE